MRKNHKIYNIIEFSLRGNLFKSPLTHNFCTVRSSFIVFSRPFSVYSYFVCHSYLLNSHHIKFYSTNRFLVEFEEKVITKFNNLPDNSVLKRSDSLVASRIGMSSANVISSLYELDSSKGIDQYFHVSDDFNATKSLPGVYCFLSKDKKSYYIGSSTNMKTRYNRHRFNLKHSDKRYSQANPKFYNYVNKYGWDSLDFGCLLVTKNYVLMYGAFDLSMSEITLLKGLVQLDLLIAEQFFLDLFGLSLNVALKVGTRESSKLSDETRKKMSDAHLNLDVTLSKDQWEAIRAKSNEIWKDEVKSVKRKLAISEFHGKSVIIKDSSLNTIGEFPSLIKAGEFLGISRMTVSNYMKSGEVYKSKYGSVTILGPEINKVRSVKIQVLDINKNLLNICNSIRETEKFYGIPASSLSNTYLDKDRPWKGKYYFYRNN